MNEERNEWRKDSIIRITGGEVAVGKMADEDDYFVALILTDEHGTEVSFRVPVEGAIRLAMNLGVASLAIDREAAMGSIFAMMMEEKARSVVDELLRSINDN